MTSKDFILTQIKSAKPKLSKFGIITVGLFGSYVRNEQNEQSDIDILIDFDSDKESFDNFMAVYDLLQNTFQNENIEIITKKGLSPYLGPEILKEVIYV